MASHGDAGVALQDSLRSRQRLGMSDKAGWLGVHSARAPLPVRAERPDRHAPPRALAASMAALP